MKLKTIAKVTSGRVNPVSLQMCINYVNVGAIANLELTVKVAALIQKQLFTVLFR